MFDAIIYIDLSNQMIKEASSFQVCEDQPCTFNNTIPKKKNVNANAIHWEEQMVGGFNLIVIYAWKDRCQLSQ